MTIPKADVLRQDGYTGFLVRSTHLPTVCPHGAWKRTSALIFLSDLDSFSPLTGNLIVFLAIKRNESQGEL